MRQMEISMKRNRNLPIAGAAYSVDPRVHVLSTHLQNAIKRRVLHDLNELHASNQWENLKRIQLESGTTPAKVDLTSARGG